MPNEFDTRAAHVAETETLGYVEYEIDIQEVLRDELPGVIDKAVAAQLTTEAISAIPDQAKGVYVLCVDEVPVYAGKTDTRHGFRARLAKHARTIQHRVRLDPSVVQFKAVRILVFSNFDVEAILIKELRRANPGALSWNDSGFGSNDPGHNRESQEPADFDKEWPIDIDRELPFLTAGEITTLGLLLQLKEGLPYTFRFETDLDDRGRPTYFKNGHQDHRNAARIPLPDEPITMRQAIQLVLNALPNGWRATLFPDRVILYKEGTEYRYAREYLRK